LSIPFVKGLFINVLSLSTTKMEINENGVVIP